MLDVVESALGSSHEVLAIAVVKLYISSDNSWEATNIVGPISISHNIEEKTHFIHLVNIGDKSIALSQELYENFHYDPTKAFFHSFEMDDCVAGLSFADEQDAANFKEAVKSCTAPKVAAVAQAKPRPPAGRPPGKGAPPQGPSPSHAHAHPPPAHPSHPPPTHPSHPPPTHPSHPPPAPPPNHPPPNRSTPPVPPSAVAHPPHPSAPISTPASTPGEAETPGAPSPATSEVTPKREGSKRSLFKRFLSTVRGDVPEDFVVSDPHSFRHESHIGWGAETGFEIRNIPHEWKKLFQQAGVKKSDLKDAETVKYMMNVIGETFSGAAGTSDATAPASEELPPPPPPSLAPPPLTTPSFAPPPLAPPSPPIAPSKSAAPPPPPGPPPPPPVSSKPPPPPLAGRQLAKPAPEVGGSRNDLLKSIQQGKELKKVSASTLPDLKSLNATQSSTLVNTLSSAMLQRRVALQDDDEEEEEEWSD